MTKTNTRSRIVSILLVLVMLLTMVPITGLTANAAEDDTSYAQAEVRDYDTFATYLRSFDSRDLKLEEDINYTIGIKDVPINVIRNQKLDLNGHKITIDASRRTGFVHLLSIRYGEFTLYDSKGGGELAVSFPDDDKAYSIIMMSSEKEDEPSKFTMNGGTLTKLRPNITHSYGASGCIGDDYFNKPENGKRSQITINGGTINCPYEWDRSKSLLNLPVKAMPLALQLLYSNLTINGGTFNGIVWTDELTREEGETEPRVVLNGGVFNSPFVVEGMQKEATQMVIDGARFNDGFHVDIAGKYRLIYVGTIPPLLLKSGVFTSPDKNPKLDIYNVTANSYGNGVNSDATARAKQEMILHSMKCFPNSAIKVNGKIYTSENIESLVGKNNDAFYLKLNSSTPIEVIPNAWGMKSVTLDGNPIDYFKDWKGTVERMDNSTAHTLKFEWYPLAQELKDAGYSYRAECDRYISGSAAVQQTDTIAADKTSHTVTIPAGADPKVYSYDLQLNLQKDGSFVGIFVNQHIVKLVVSEAPVVDTRTSIESVTLKVPKLKEGAASGDNFTLSGTNTGVSTINTVWENIPSSGAVAGKFYVARITLTAKDGYAFNTKTQVKLNGDYLSKGSGIDNGGAGMTILVNVPVRHEHKYGAWQIAGNGNVHFRKCSCGVQEEKPHEWKYLEGQDKYKCTVCGYEIDGEKERITYVYASPRSPIAGEHPGDYTPAEWIKIGGANYKVESIVWKNMNDTDVTTFESGKIYKGTVTFKADTGFAFDGDRIYASQIFDSSNAEVVGNYTLTDEGSTLTATFKLKDVNVVRPGLKAKVKLPTLNDKIGQSLPAAELVDTTLPENVELVYSVCEDNLLGEAITDPDYKVKSNQKYVYVVWLKYGDSTDITEITKTYNVSYEVTDGGDTETCTDFVGYGVLAIYQTPDTSKINSVALTVTAPKYGKAPATTATGANDTRYTVGTPTWSPAVTDGKFGANTYTVSIPVTAAEGYSFDENGIYTINGYVATYADGKVSYTFPQLTAPHTHDTDVQPWVYMDPGTHIKTCTAGDDFKVEAHDFSAWTKIDESTHSRTCSKCKKSGEATNYTETAEHTWVWVVDQEAALNQPGKQHEECTGCHAKRSENTEIPALRDYAVTVTGGTATVAAGTSITRAMEGVEVTVTADAPKTGKVFDKWVVLEGSVTLADATKATTTFTMPASAVKLEATYKDAPPSHSVYVGMTYTAGNFIYQITSIDTATLGQSKVIGVVAAKKNKIKKVTIPDRADCKGYRLNVTTIGNNAFAGCKVLKKLTIGNKVTVIGKNAFKKCSKLKTVVIGKAVKTISSKAFTGDNKIKKITFKGKKLKTVKKNAFSKKAKKNIKSKKTKLKGNKKAIKLFKKKLKIK